MMKKRVFAILCAGTFLLTACGKNGAETESLSGEEAEITKDSLEALEEEVVEELTYDKLITINASDAITTNGGIFEGFGTALCWWANRIGYSDTLSQQAAELFYGEDGLRFNIMRYNIGGGDDPTHDHITRTDSEVPGWLYIGEDGEYYYDYEADARQLNVLKRCYEEAQNPYVETFANSAPYFYTVSGCTSGAELASDNNLKEENYGDFAEYLATVDEYINNELGITVNSISPINEPSASYWGAYSSKQEGCHMDPGELQSKMFVETAKAFEAHGLDDVEIVGSDETSTAHAIASYNALTDEAKAVLDRVSAHTYDTTAIKSLKALQESEGFNLWMSEVDGGSTYSKAAGEMGSALYIVNKMISDINDLHPSAWVMWQAIDNHISSEGFNGNTDSGMVDVNDGFWGLCVADHDNENIILTQKYYGMGQITRYIRAGYTVIPTGNSSYIAATNPETGEVVIVAMNGTADDLTVCFDVEGLELSGDVQVIRTSGSVDGGESWAEVDKFSAEGWDKCYALKGYSITTFVIG